MADTTSGQTANTDTSKKMSTLATICDDVWKTDRDTKEDTFTTKATPTTNNQNNPEEKQK